jgi:hypothetical protein
MVQNFLRRPIVIFTIGGSILASPYLRIASFAGASASWPSSPQHRSLLPLVLVRPFRHASDVDSIRKSKSPRRIHPFADPLPPPANPRWQLRPKTQFDGYALFRSIPAGWTKTRGEFAGRPCRVGRTSRRDPADVFDVRLTFDPNSFPVRRLDGKFK